MLKQNMCGINYFSFAALILQVFVLETYCFGGKLNKVPVSKVLIDLQLADKNNDLEIFSRVLTTVNTQNRVIRELETSLGKINNKVEELQNRLVVQDQEITKLKSENTKIVALEASVYKLNRVIESLPDKIKEQNRLVQTNLALESSIIKFDQLAEFLQRTFCVEVLENANISMNCTQFLEESYDMGTKINGNRDKKVGKYNDATEYKKQFNRPAYETTIPSQKRNYTRKEYSRQVALQSESESTQSVNKHVAFSAYLDHDLLHIGLEAKVICNRILFNSDRVYNTDTGVFTAPQTGVYFFTFSIHNFLRETNVQLLLDGHHVVSAVVQTAGVAENNMASNSAVISVNIGQSVWLQQYFDTDGELVSRDNYRQVTFTGFRLY